MRESLETVDAAMASRVEQDAFETVRTMIRLLQPGPITTRHGIEIYFTGAPFFILNGMLGCALSEDTVEAAVLAEVRAMKERGLPFMWMPGSSAAPSGIGEILEREGLRPVTMPGMWVWLDRLVGPACPPPGIEVREVTAERDLDHWADVLSRGSGLPPTVAQTFIQAARAGGLGPGSPIRPFLAFADEKPAGTSTLMTSTGQAGIYNVGTLAEARRRGVGTAVTVAALRAGQASGLTTGVLFASEMGYPIYEKMGFRPCLQLTMYVWHGPESSSGKE